MTAVLYADRITESPYRDIVDPANVDRTADLFVAERCRMEGLHFESPLQVLCVLFVSTSVPSCMSSCCCCCCGMMVFPRAYNAFWYAVSM